MNRLALEVKAFVSVLRDGPRLFLLVPVIPLIVMVPEFVQHVAEIRLGMFASLNAFKALNYDHMRMTFGVIKVAATFVGFLAAARFWTNRAGGRSPLFLDGLSWKRLVVALAMNVAISLASAGLARVLPNKLVTPASVIFSVATLPFLVFLMAVLLEDPLASLGRAYRSGWAKALRMAVFFAIPFFALQMLHRYDHMAALGQPPPVVWTLMAWDTLAVGLMIAIGGTALHHGYAGPEALEGERGRLNNGA